MNLARARGIPKNIERLINILQNSSGNEIEEALSRVRRTKGVDFEKVVKIENTIDSIQEHEKQQRLKIQKQRERDNNKEPLRVLQAIYDQNAGHSELLEKYPKMNPIELKKIAVKIPHFEPPFRSFHLKKVKPQAYEWLEHLMLQKETETPETPQKKSRIHRVLHR